MINKYLAIALLLAGPVHASDPGAARQSELVRLVRQDCGSCHGMQLTGGLGLPLTAEALRDKPFDGLVATVVYGRPGTAMPPWKTILSEPEAEWIVRQLMQGFPTEVR
ncbi:MAG: cytochrome c [Gammaproteobacteria bacterium]|nr:cytochrome c [Gammaproteobacteria bacterium]MBU1646399.1 cytochrome c [Gammaproteobacteria bacterium]MBU1970942.1 cytochrome c [Gammaproteobacteria bacterium]